MSTCFRFSPLGRERLRRLERILDDFYNAPEAILGNQSDPLDEAVYIILSFQTDLSRFKATWTKLRSVFAHWEDLARAPLRDVAEALREGGLQHQKALAIKRLLRAVKRDFGELSLDSLRELDDSSAEKVLCRLPGLSWKGARCVLLYSLGRQVFPIDGNTFRILQRVGVTPLSAVYRRRSLHDAIQDAVPADRRRRFHVNLVVHGQRICLPERPICTTCPVVAFCPKRGLPRVQMNEVRRQSRGLSPQSPHSCGTTRASTTPHVTIGA